MWVGVQLLLTSIYPPPLAAGPLWPPAFYSGATPLPTHEPHLRSSLSLLGADPDVPSPDHLTQRLAAVQGAAPLGCHNIRRYIYQPSYSLCAL